MENSERIRERAHQIWESEGRPESRHAEHWARAQEELRREGVLGDNALSHDFQDGALSQSTVNTSDAGAQADGRVLDADKIGAAGGPDESEEAVAATDAGRKASDN
ncbi:MAG: DUF2934 domain-containing protein [Albidovulum sp.]